MGSKITTASYQTRERPQVRWGGGSWQMTISLDISWVTMGIGKPQENHRKSIGKWWFSMGFYGRLPSGKRLQKTMDNHHLHGKSHYLLRHVQWLCNKLPEGNEIIAYHWNHISFISYIIESHKIMLRCGLLMCSRQGFDL